MARYMVYAREMVYSMVEVEADSEADAMDKAWSNQEHFKFDEYDSDSFDIYEAELLPQEEA